MKNKILRIKEIILSLKGLTTLGVTDLLANAISAIFWFYMASLLGAKSYGEVSYVLAIAGISSTVSLIGSQNTLTVYTAKNEKIQSSIYFLTLSTGTFASILLFIIFSNSGMSLLNWGYVVLGLASSELLGRKLYKSYSKFMIIQRIIMVVLAIGLYYSIGPSGVIIGIGISFFIYLVILYNGFRDSPINFRLLKTHSKFMMNSYVLNLASSVGTSVDRLLIAPIFGYTILGNYQLGLQFLSILQIFPNIIYKYTLSHDASGIPNLRLKKITVIISTAIALLLSILAPFIVPIFFSKYDNAVTVIQIISLANIPSSITFVYQSGFLGTEKSKVVVFGQIIYLVSQVVGILLLGQMFGINGVAFALFVALSIECLFYFIINKYV